MSISMISSILSVASILGGADQTRQISPTATPARSEIDAIREKGFTAWAHETKMEALKERIRQELMAERKLTEDGIAALPEAQRTTVEDEIARLIQERLEQTLQATAEEAAEGGRTEGVLLNIMV